MWSNIKIVVEEQILSENVQLPTFCWSMTTDHDECVGTYHHQQTNQSQETNKKTKVIQKRVSPEVTKLNHGVMNKKQDQMQFSLEKGLKKENGFIKPITALQYQSMDCVMKQHNRFIDSTRNYFISLKMFIMEQRKRIGSTSIYSHPTLAKTGSFSYYAQLYYMQLPSYSAMMIRLIQNQNEEKNSLQYVCVVWIIQFTL